MNSRIVSILSVVLVVAGLVLGATVDMAFLALFGLGALGPSILRALGILRDLDEFEVRAMHRAGFHAFVAAGVFLCAVAAIQNAGNANLDHDAVPSTAALAVLLVTYLSSRLISYWGTREAAFRVLVVFGSFWLAFAFLSHPGLEGLMEALVTVPFFALAFASRRWPRVAGVLLLLSAAAAFHLFKLHRAFSGNHGSLMVLIVFFVPLLAMGIALLLDRGTLRGE